MLRFLSRLGALSPTGRVVLSLLPLVAIVAIAVLGLRAARHVHAHSRAVVHTHAVLSGIAFVRGRIVDAESGVRGFMAAGRDVFLGPYRGARADVERGLDSLARLTRDNPAQRSRLDTLRPLVRARLDSLDAGLEHARTWGADSTRAWLSTRPTAALMARVRTLLGAMELEERRLLEARLAAEAREARGATLGVGVGLVVAVLAGIVLNLALAGALTRMRRALDERDATLGALDHANRQLGEQAAELEVTLAQVQEQAVELEATNEELQSQALELEEANEELRDARDELERRAATLRRSEARYAGIVGSAMDAIISADAQQRIVVFNRSAERVLRCPAEQAIGSPLTRFVPERFRERHEEDVRAFARTGVTSRTMGAPGVLRALRDDGVEIPIEATISQIEQDGERLFTVILRDISERQALEAQLLQAQKMEAVGQLAGGIAHDFNNLLTVISGSAQFARAELAPDHPAAADLAEIDRAARRAALLTRQLLAFSRKQVLQPRAVELGLVVRDAESLLRRVIGEHIELETVLDPHPGVVLADPGQLEQVLVNLAVNARDAMTDGGRLTIETGTLRLGDEDLDRWPDLAPGEFVRLAVRDTGAGMDDHTRARAFEPFFTTKEPGRGTGLGLSMVYGIVRQSGGAVRLDSRPGDGATATILLPLVAERPAPPVSAPSHEAPGRETVLLVEDEDAVRTAARRMLERNGYRVVEARHGAEAVRRWRELGGAVDLVVSDMRMPEMGGLELAVALRRERADLPVLFLSGYLEFSATALDQRRDAFLEKPFSRETLLQAVRASIDRARGAAGGR